jgi:hypothetical protein
VATCYGPDFGEFLHWPTPFPKTLLDCGPCYGRIIPGDMGIPSLAPRAYRGGAMQALIGRAGAARIPALAVQPSLGAS